MDYKILVVDDDEHTHVIVEDVLKDEFDLVHAKDSQEAIDMLSDQQVNLILSDIHMPGMTGLEFLQSLMADTDKRDIPVLIMTNLPTVEKEKKALNLGAADFISKVRLINDQEGVRKQIQMKLVSNVSISNSGVSLHDKKSELTSKVMEAAIKDDFEETVSVICDTLVDQFKVAYAAFWVVDGDSSALVASSGPAQPAATETINFKDEQGYRIIEADRKAYLTNHIFNENTGFMQDFSEQHDLPAEIAIPMYNINERALLMNNMKIPDDADLFGVLFIKRNKLFSTNEYDLISGLMMQFGSVLWRLYSKGE